MITGEIKNRIRTTSIARLLKQKWQSIKKRPIS